MFAGYPYMLNMGLGKISNNQLRWKRKARVTSYELKSTSYEFKLTSYEFRSSSYEFKSPS